MVDGVTSLPSSTYGAVPPKMQEAAGVWSSLLTLSIEL